MSGRILVVDDDPVQCRLLEAMLQKSGYEAVTLDNGDAALALLTGADGGRIDCMILDLVMPNLDGLGVLARLRQAAINVPVIVQTAHGGIDNVVSAMRAGAIDFVVKPTSVERLHVSLRNALNTSALEGESITASSTAVPARSALPTSSLRARPCRPCCAHGGKGTAARPSFNVLISGKVRKVGKELIACAIHGSSDRRAKPFVAVNCGAMPENLVESILFGHEKGSFTGATERHTGKFVEASGGTLFLDEVGELPAPAQVKLLRAIQGKAESSRSARARPVERLTSARSATNRDLDRRRRAGRPWRCDLFYRLHVSSDRGCRQACSAPSTFRCWPGISWRDSRRKKASASG